MATVILRPILLSSASGDVTRGRVASFAGGLSGTGDGSFSDTHATGNVSGRCQQPLGRAGRWNGRFQRTELHYLVLRLRHCHQHRAEQHRGRARRLEWRHDRPIASLWSGFRHVAELSRRARGHQCRLDSPFDGFRSGERHRLAEFRRWRRRSELRADRSHHVVGQRELGPQQRGRRPRGRQRRVQQLLRRAVAGIVLPDRHDLVRFHRHRLRQRRHRQHGRAAGRGELSDLRPAGLSVADQRLRQRGLRRALERAAVSIRPREITTPPPPRRPRAAADPEAQLIQNLVQDITLASVTLGEVVNTQPLNQPPPGPPHTGPGPPPAPGGLPPQFGARFFTPPPMGETHFVKDEVVLQIPTNIPLAQLQSILAPLGLSITGLAEHGPARRHQLQGAYRQRHLDRSRDQGAGQSTRSSPARRRTTPTAWCRIRPRSPEPRKTPISPA